MAKKATPAVLDSKPVPLIVTTTHSKRLMYSSHIKHLRRTGLVVLCLAFVTVISPGASETVQKEENTATVVGRVPLPEAPSPAVMAKRYEIVSKGGILSTIPPVGVVWLEGSFPKDTNQDTPVVQVVQEDLVFDPALLIIRPGTIVEFPNRDDEYHNVFSYSPTKRFDLGRYLPEERPVPSQVFDKPGMVTLRCDIHEHMRAIILVIDSPFYVQTDPEGHFRISNVPEGEYVLKAWINSRKTLEREIRLKAGETTEVNFSRD